MSEADASEIRRKRLRWRSWHRGTREMDLLVGGFADSHIDCLSDEQLDRLEHLLRAPDPDLYAWILGYSAPPAEFDNDIMQLMRDHKFSPQSG